MKNGFEYKFSKENDAATNTDFYTTRIMLIPQAPIVKKQEVQKTVVKNNKNSNIKTNSATPFITIWNIENTQNKIVFPGVGYNYTIEWEEIGTGVKGNDIVSGTTTISFNGIQNATNKIKLLVYSGQNGSFEAVKFTYQTASNNNLLEVAQWGNTAFKTFSFFGCEQLDITATDVPNLSVLTSMEESFRKCRNLKALNTPIDKWNVSNIKNMHYLFAETHKFNALINNWNTSKVTNMEDMFMEAFAFNQPLDKWNVSNVTNMEGMFKGTYSFNQDISNTN